MYYGEIKNRQKVEVSCGDPSKLHLVFNIFRAPTPLEKFQYASTFRWKLGTVIDKYRLKAYRKRCEYVVVVAFNERLVKETTRSHRDQDGFIPMRYRHGYVENIDYAWINFDKDKKSLRIRSVQNEVPQRNLSGISAALASDPWALPICLKDADDWTDEDLNRFGKEFYCKHFGGTLGDVKINDILTVINDIKTVAGACT